jgi:hypothetical protein
MPCSARRRTRGPRPRPHHAPRHQHRQLLAATLGQSAPATQSRGQGTDRPPAGPSRDTRLPQKAPPPGAAQPGHPLRPRPLPALPGALPPNPGGDDPKSTWHQVAELPDTAAEVTEYQGHFRTCPCCGTLNHAAIPAELKASSVGPRLTAALAYFAGCHHVSKRGLEKIAGAVLEVPLALGTASLPGGADERRLGHPPCRGPCGGTPGRGQAHRRDGSEAGGAVALAVAGGHDRRGRSPDPRPPRLPGAQGAVGQRRDWLPGR